MQNLTIREAFTVMRISLENMGRVCNYVGAKSVNKVFDKGFN